MIPDSGIETGANREVPVIEVKHSELERASEESLYRSVCPVCKHGYLMVGRNPKDMSLMAEDYCIWCAQRFRYLDIDNMNRREGREPQESSSSTT